MPNILVTGGCGFVGSNAVNDLIESGHKVVAFDNFFRKDVEKNLAYLLARHDKDGDFSFVYGDILHPKTMDFVCKNFDIDFIIHTAAQTTMVTSVTDPREDFEINAIGSFNVCDVARKNDIGVLHMATNKVYGNGVNTIDLKEGEKRWEFEDEAFQLGIGEDFSTDWDEHSPYGCSKYTGDLYARDFGHTYGIPTGSFRCSTMFGVRQFGVVEQGWILHFIISAMKKRPVTIFGDGKQVRDCLYISDITNLFDKVVKNPKLLKNEAFNLGGGPENSLSILELVDILKEIGLDNKYSFDDWRLADQKVYISDISKVCRRFDWKPEVTPKEGIKLCAQWVETNQDLF